MLREDGFKFCKGCNEWKLASENFYKSSVSRYDGYLTYCKMCEKARVIRYQKAHPEKKAEYDRRTNAKPARKARLRVTKKAALEGRKTANPDKIAEQQRTYQKRYRDKDIEAFRARHRSYYAANLEHCRSLQRQSAARPKRQASIKEQSRLRSALLRPGSFFENEDGQLICYHDWLKLLDVFNHACAYCEVQTDIEIDHITPKYLGGKNELGNLVPACEKCNGLKGRRAPEKFCTPERLADIRLKAKITPHLTTWVNTLHERRHN